MPPKSCPSRQDADDFHHSASRGTDAEHRSVSARLYVEPLESKLLLTGIRPSEIEQYFIYLLNRARSDPTQYQIERELDIELSGIPPRPPVAVNSILESVAHSRALEMAEHNYFGHQSEVTGKYPNQVVREAGYELPHFFSDFGNSVESLAAGFESAEETLEALIVDEGIDPPAHRMHLLGLEPFGAGREIGVGWATSETSTFGTYWAIELTYSDPSDQFLTGVVYDDLDGDRRFSLGEAVPGVTIRAGNSVTTTNDGGGWSLPVTDGTVEVTASGGAFQGVTTTSVLVNGQNIALDFIVGSALVQLDFEDQVATHLPPRDASGNPPGADFDGDGQSDLAVYHPATRPDEPGFFIVQHSSDGAEIRQEIGALRVDGLGQAYTDFPVTGDYDGDGKADFAVYGYVPHLAYSVFTIVQSSNGETLQRGFGGGLDFPIVGDFDGDGRDDIVVYGFSPINGFSRFGIFPSSEGFRNARTVGFGGPDDFPVTGDFDGDQVDDLAVFGFSGDEQRARFGFIPSSQNGGTVSDGQKEGAFPLFFGGAEDTPVGGDFDGDGQSDVVIYGPDGFGSTRFLILPTSDDLTDLRDDPNPELTAIPVSFDGISSAVAVQETDFDGDGRTELTLFGELDGDQGFLSRELGDITGVLRPFGSIESIPLPSASSLYSLALDRESTSSLGASAGQAATVTEPPLHSNGSNQREPLQTDWMIWFDFALKHLLDSYDEEEPHEH